MPLALVGDGMPQAYRPRPILADLCGAGFPACHGQYPFAGRLLLSHRALGVAQFYRSLCVSHGLEGVAAWRLGLVVRTTLVGNRRNG